MLDFSRRSVRTIGIAALTLCGCGADSDIPSPLSAQFDIEGPTTGSDETPTMDAGASPTDTDASSERPDAQPDAGEAPDQMSRYARILRVASSGNCHASLVTDADGDSALAISDFNVQTSRESQATAKLCSLTIALDVPDEEAYTLESFDFGFDADLDEGSGLRVTTAYDFFDPTRRSSRTIHDVFGSHQGPTTITSRFTKPVARRCGDPTLLVLDLMFSLASRVDRADRVTLRNVGKVRISSHPCQ